MHEAFTAYMHVNHSPLKKYPDIIIALGNGHAFKFAPVIGRVVAELAIDGETSDDISKFPVPSPLGSSKI